MNDITVEGMAIAPQVVETIVSIAAKDIEGVIGLATPSSTGVLGTLQGRKSEPAVVLDTDDEGKLLVTLRIIVEYGYNIPDVAQKVRESIFEEVNAQVGVEVGAVDIFVDGVEVWGRS